MAHILVVDDHQDLRLVIRDVLEGEGHSIIEAGDGDQAVALLRASPVPLVALIDLHLGRWTDPNPVIAALATEPSLAARHAYVWMTAGSLMEAEEATIPVRRYGVRLVGKPFDLDGLLATIAEAAQSLPSGDGDGKEPVGDPVPASGVIGSGSC